MECLCTRNVCRFDTGHPWPQANTSTESEIESGNAAGRLVEAGMNPRIHQPHSFLPEIRGPPGRGHGRSSRSRSGPSIPLRRVEQGQPEAAGKPLLFGGKPVEVNMKQFRPGPLAEIP